MVGTIRKNEQHLPESFTRTASAGTVRYAYDTTKTLVSHCPKKDKVVLLLSSLHKNGKTDEVTDKPEIIEYYNRTKRGRDSFNQLFSLYSCSRLTMWWPMRFFMEMLDQAGANSGILFNLIPRNTVKDRREFMEELALALVIPYLKEKVQMPRLPRKTKDNILKIIGQAVIQCKKQTSDVDKRCSFCPTKANRKIACCYSECVKQFARSTSTYDITYDNECIP